MKIGVFVTRAWVICALLFIISNSLFAKKQNVVLHSLHKHIGSARVRSNITTPQNTVRILAIMVEFEKDSNDQTTGDGTFQTTGSAAQIDPPPHDSLYFNNKIQFVENYFHSVSNGYLTITGYVIPQKITLPGQMASYSPPTVGNDNQNLAALAQESWHIADSLYPEIDFSKYDAFVIFHAGVGRDIDLISSLGYNPTPFDIPSLYLDSTAFANAFASNSFSGFSVNNGNYYIKNTIILPETESRIIPSDAGDDTLQLSMNGMFAASVGSYLGLPDLFNTLTGSSGIGEYGLMDGAGIFAYNGLFPPEPCAWEKIYLGWVTTPIIIVNSSANVSVPAVGLKYPLKQDTIYKIPISSSEYFLVENRNRNPKGTGLDIKIANANGDTLWRHFNQDTVGFRYYFDGSFDVSGISGSIVDISNFDWALPGFIDTTHLYDGGGILIWHIDENVIQAGLSTNTVNANPDHRGVDLEEADGSQDIGQNYVAFSDPGYGTQNGWALDCWFKENYTRFYKNIFDQNSFPNSNSYSGAASLVTINNFSIRLPRMTVSVEIGSQLIHRDSLLRHAFANTSVNSFPTSTKNHIYLPTSNGIYALQNNGQSLFDDTIRYRISSSISTNSVAVTVLPDSTEIIASVQDSILRLYAFHNGQSSIDSSKKAFAHRFTTSPCIAKLGYTQLDSLSVLVGAELGTIYQFNTNGDTISTRSVGTNPVSSITLLPTSSSATPNEYFFTSGNKIYAEQSTADLPASLNSWMLAAAVSPKGNYIISAEINGSKIVSYNQSLSQKNFEINLPNSGILELAIADIDGDGEKYVIIQSSTALSVINRTGYMLDGFPIQARAGLSFTGTPLVVDFNGDGKPEIVLLTNDGEMWVYNGSGKLLSGFPIQVTSPGNAFPTAYTSPLPSNQLGIAILSASGSLDAFLTSTLATPASLTWWQYLCDNNHSSADARVPFCLFLLTRSFFQSRVSITGQIQFTAKQLKYGTIQMKTQMLRSLFLTLPAGK